MRKTVEQGHTIVTDENKLAKETEQTEGKKLNSKIDETLPEANKQAPTDDGQEEKWSIVLILTGAASFFSAGVKFIKGEPETVYDEAFAERLKKTGFFKVGE